MKNKVHRSLSLDYSIRYLVFVCTHLVLIPILVFTRDNISNGFVEKDAPFLYIAEMAQHQVLGGIEDSHLRVVLSILNDGEENVLLYNSKVHQPHEKQIFFFLTMPGI